jgi:hypothetical protein
MKIETYLTREKFDNGCMFTGSRSSRCTDASGNGWAPRGEPGHARFLVREQRDAKAAAIIGRDYTDLAACVDHMFDVYDVDGWTIHKVADVTFAEA